MANDKIIGWFTANGKHIPIFEKSNPTYAEQEKDRQISVSKEQANVASGKETRVSITPQHIRSVLKKAGYSLPVSQTAVTKKQGHVALEKQNVMVGMFVEKVIGGGVQIYSNGRNAINDIKVVAEKLKEMGYSIEYTPNTVMLYVNSKEVK